MKALIVSLATCFTLPALCGASAYSESLERLSVSDPEFVFFADVEKDFPAIGAFLSETYLAYLRSNPEAPAMPVNFTQVFQHLGLNGLKSAIWASEARPAGGFLNQAMFTFEESPSGAFLLMGDSNRPFTIFQSAPANADMAGEFFFNGQGLFQIIRGFLIDLLGETGQGLVDDQVNQSIGDADGPTIAEIIKRLTTRVEIAVQLPENPPADLPPAFAMLQGQAVIRLANVADLLDTFTPMLTQAGFTPMEGVNAPGFRLHVDSGPAPVTVLLHGIADTNDLLVSFSDTGKGWFLEHDTPIGTSESFLNSIEGLPRTGLSFWYSSERMARLQVDNLDAQIPADNEVAPMIAVLKSFLGRFVGEQVGVSYLDGNAYRVMAYQPASYKTNMAIAAAVVPMGIAAGVLPMIKAQKAAKDAADNESWDSGYEEEEDNDEEDEEDEEDLPAN